MGDVLPVVLFLCDSCLGLLALVRYLVLSVFACLCLCMNRFYLITSPSCEDDGVTCIGIYTDIRVILSLCSAFVQHLLKLYSIPVTFIRDGAGNAFCHELAGFQQCIL